MTDTALQLFRARSTAGQTTVLVFYRGERSFFCRQWLRRWLTIPALDRRLDLSDAALLFISSQSQGKAFSVADQMAATHPLLDRRIFFFGDPEHALVHHLRSANLPTPVITNPDSHRAHAWVFDFGMVQPAILAFPRNSAPIYDWTARPSLLNGAGKLDRPDPWDVWDCIERRLDRMRIFRSRTASNSQPNSSNADPVQHLLSNSIPTSNSASSPSSLHASDMQRSSLEDTQAGPRVVAPRCSSSRSIGSYPTNQKSAKTSNRLSARLSPTYLSAGTTPSDEFISAAVMSRNERGTIDGQHGHPDEHADVPVHELSEQISAIASGLLLSRSLPLSADARRPHEPTYSLPQSSIASSSQEEVPHSRITLDRDESSAKPIAVDANCAASDSSTHLDELASLSVSDEDTEEDETARGVSKGLADDMVDRRQDESCSDILASINPDASHEPQKQEPAEPLSSTLDNLEVSMASCGSDQVESANVISKHTSLRTVDSAVINTMQYESNSFSSGKRIKEESVEAETGISDYLRELKDPAFFVDGRFVLHNDVMQEENPDDVNILRASTPDESDLRRSTAEARVNNDFFNNRLRSTYRHSTGTVGRVLLEKTASFLPMLSQTEPQGMNPSSSPLHALTEPSDPSFQESRRPQRSVVDLSPFADADNDIAIPEENLTTNTMRDEYEAYDEYVVCEFEVEEHVDEYDSDAVSRPPTTHPGVNNERQDASSLTQDRHTGREAHVALLSQGPHTSALGLRYEVDGKFNMSSDPRGALSNEPSLTPALESHILQFRDDHETTSAGAQVRRALRRIKVPRISGSRRLGSKANAAGGAGQDSLPLGSSQAGRTAAESGHDTRNGARKGTGRFEQRKRPTSTPAGARNSSRMDGRREESQAGADQVDEDSARVSRKETLKSVLKRLPYKNRRRLFDENVERTDATQRERVSYGNSQSPSRPSSPTRQGPFQAVLQRLPSIHLQHREGTSLYAQGTTPHAEDPQAVGSETNRQGRLQSPKRSSRRDSVRRSGRGRFMRGVVGCHGASSSLNEDVGGMTESESEAETLAGMPSGAGDDRATNEMVGPPDSQRNGKNTRRTMFSRASPGADVVTMDDGEFAVRRLESDILTRTVTGVDGISAMDRSRLSRSIGNDEPSNGRKNSRRRRREERDEGGERVVAKLSFASVSERILSKFKG